MGMRTDDNDNGFSDMKKETESEKTPNQQRQPVTYRYDGLNWDFIKMMAEIAYYAGNKYPDKNNLSGYFKHRLHGEKGPINHIVEHLRQYLNGEPHDHFNDRAYQLAAIAYNAMMEALYLRKFGTEVTPFNLTPREDASE